MTEVIIKKRSRFKRLLRLPKIIKQGWDFTNHPAISFIERVRHIAVTVRIIMAA